MENVPAHDAGHLVFAIRETKIGDLHESYDGFCRCGDLLSLAFADLDIPRKAA